MKAMTTFRLPLVLAIPVLVSIFVPFSGCSHSSPTVVAEGVILSVSYQDGDGKTVGMTRLNDSRAVPGLSGTWNIDAYGKVTRDYVMITRPQRKDLGVLVIPASRLVSIQFGDGGIQQVDEGKPR